MKKFLIGFGIIMVLMLICSGIIGHSEQKKLINNIDEYLDDVDWEEEDVIQEDIIQENSWV